MALFDLRLASKFFSLYNYFRQVAIKQHISSKPPEGFALLQIGYSATKDDMRFYVRLKIGVVGIKLQALIGLYEVVTDNEKGVKIGTGVVTPLIIVLESESDMIWQGTCYAHAGVTALLKLCRNGDCRAELVGLVCGVREVLLGLRRLRGVVMVFANVAKSKDGVLMINAIKFLQAVAYGLVLDQLLFFLRNGGLWRKPIEQWGMLNSCLSHEVPQCKYQEITRNLCRKNVTLDCFSNIRSLGGKFSARRKIVNSGYLKNIKNLAESEVYDAKKPARKLSRDRYRSMQVESGTHKF
ncbi:hypothetical protein RJ641_015505 [Dillenia turbinata]|uniref:Uncharacterized protein n=1 Tax=Dillenia turbinata TaxID=194707 RepID=A0AAN8UXS8_9MAGN